METMTFATVIKSASNGTVVSDSTTYSAAAEQSVEQICPAGEVLQVDLDVDVSQLVAWYVRSDEAVEFRTNVNTDEGADYKLSLAAKKAVYWNTDRPEVNPIADDITILFFDNSAGEEDATVKAGFLLDVDSTV